MGLFNVLLVILSLAGLLLVILGFQRKSQIAILLGGIALLAPIFYYIGWTVFLPLVAPIALAISFLGKKKVRST